MKVTKWQMQITTLLQKKWPKIESAIIKDLWKKLYVRQALKKSSKKEQYKATFKACTSMNKSTQNYKTGCGQKQTNLKHAHN